MLKTKTKMVNYRNIVLLFLFLMGVFPAAAQNEALTGRVVEKGSRKAMDMATVQLYKISTSHGKSDTTYVAGAFADRLGHFAFQNVGFGSYLLKVTYLGYKLLARNVTKLNGRPAAVGDLVMEPDAVVLDEAVVTANIPKMVIRDDTLIFNADAFRVPEGSVIEALVEALPGAKIDDNGGITVNGKSVKRFKMDGRDFMTGNNSAVMKNLPSYVIDQVKAYDEKSDLSKMTGIDDGNDDFVLEFVTKRSARRGLQMNPDVGYGTDHRYGIRLTAMKPFGDMRYTFMGNANNVNDRNFSGRGGRGRGNGSGQRHSKSSALDISYENGKNLRVNGRVTWNHNTADNWNRTGSENFVNTRGGAFSNSISQNYSRSNGWTGNMNLQWVIDSATTLSFRPDVNFSTNDGRGFSHSASFNVNPFDVVRDPLDKESLELMDGKGLVVNGRDNKSMSYGSSKSLSSQLQIFRRMGRNGRNAAFSSNISYRSGRNKNANLTAVRLYQTQDQWGNDSTYQTNRFSISPSDSYNYSLGLTYTEPLYIFKVKEAEEDDDGRPMAMQGNRGRRGTRGIQGIFLQLSYRYNYSHQKSDPSTYDFPEFSDEALSQVLQDYRDWTRLFGFLDNPYEDYLSTRLSRYSERTEHGHNAEMQLRVVRDQLNLNVGVSVQPQKTHFIQQYLGTPVDTVRSVANVSPTLNLRYRFNQQTNLQVRFRGTTSQPSLTQLLDIYDDTNPLSISMGNPGLKPAFSSNLNVNYQMQRRPKLVTDSLGFSIPKAQRHWSFSAYGGWQSTRNSIGNVVTYNEKTGGRISRPENINGNWSGNAGMTFNVALDTLNRWDVSGSVGGNYNHHVGYVNLNRTAIPDRNVTHTYSLNPSTSISYRNKWLNVSLNSNLTYARTKNRLQASNNLTTWNFSYGGNTRITFPWGTNLSTDFHVFSKRGYSDQTLNTNELIWNAQLSQSFLRGKKLTVMLQWYDILHEQSNFSRTVNANGWTDREVNAITSYAMLHVSYRLNFFGGGEGGRGEGRGERFGRRGGDFDGPRGNRPEGRGFGGGGFGGGGFGDRR